MKRILTNVYRSWKDKYPLHIDEDMRIYKKPMYSKQMYAVIIASDNLFEGL